MQKYELQQLQSKSLKEVKAIKADAEKRKAELEALKAKGGKGWTSELQEELDDIVIFLVDVDDVITQKEAEKPAETEAKPKGYEVPEGTENMVHLKLIRGHRYSSKTGKEVSSPFIQMFSFSEYQLFKNNYQSLGYEVVEILYNPYENK